MPYTPTTWTGGPGGTEITATRLTNLEGGVSAATRKDAALADLVSTKLAREVLTTADGQSMLPWFFGLAQRDTAPAKIVAIGDSGTEGQGASARANRWTNRLVDRLRRMYMNGTGGQEYLPAYGTTLAPDSGWAVATYTNAGNMSQSSAAGLGLHSVVMNAACSISWSVTGDSADIRWYGFSGGGHFTWQVDGGAATDITATAGSDQPANVTHISLGAAAAHTVKVNWVSGNPIIEGLTVFNGDYTTGIHVYNAGRYGYTAANFVDTAIIPTGGSTSIKDGHKAIVANIAPHLVILAIGSNDWLNDNGTTGTPTAVQGRLQTLITDCSAFTYKPSIIIPAQYNIPSGMSTSAFPYSAYIDMFRTLEAGNTNVKVLDFSRRFPTPTAVPYVSATDNLHLSNAGQSLMADYYFAALRPA
jgi:lysophospholipase L1-like esterase